MNTYTRQKKLRALFDQSMEKGGAREFRKQFERSIGVHRNESGIARFDPDKREVDHRTFAIGEVMDGLLGPQWRHRYEQCADEAAMSRLRYEGVGGMVLPGDLPTVSAAIDVIAGLANARMLERPLRPEWIWDSFCTVEQPTGEGGFDIGTRPDGAQAPRDIAKGVPLPTVNLVGTRIHRNKSLETGLALKIHRDTIRDDLTGSLMQSADEVADQVLFERERKVCVAALGLSKGTGSANTFATTVSSGVSIGLDDLAIPVVQDGLTFFPYQKGTYGSNAGSAHYSTENGKAVRNYGNCNFTDGIGLADYNCLTRALGILAQNRDPFTGLPCITNMAGMTILVSPASMVQLEFLLQADALWQVLGASGLSTANASNTVSGYNYAAKLGLNLKSSPVWANLMVDWGTTTLAANGTYAHLAFNATAGYATAASINSAMYLGHFKDALKYNQRIPYQVVQAPLGPQELSEACVAIQHVREAGSPYWVNPRVVFRSFA